MAVQEGQSGVPCEACLAAVAEIEDVAGARDYEKFGRPAQFGQPFRQAARFLNAGRAVARAVYQEDWSPD